MLEKAQIWEHSNNGEEFRVKERAVTVLRRLQALKNEISQLRLECEELRKQRLEDQDKGLLCSECGESIESGQEIVVKDSAGMARSCYHQNCFKSLLH